jgi:hypothetical protein
MISAQQKTIPRKGAVTSEFAGGISVKYSLDVLTGFILSRRQLRADFRRLYLNQYTFDAHDVNKMFAGLVS